VRELSVGDLLWDGHHLFFDSQLSGMVWTITHAVFSLPKFHSVTYMFGQWLMGIAN
jgi:hypothetical protein